MTAQRAGDETASHVYKILMNSFYGVLGASDCRYARTELAGAVTTFGRKYLEWTRDWFVARGLTVLYGDTDSVFVQVDEDGAELARQLNADLASSIAAEYGVESFLELRAEKRYRRFLIPRMRGPGNLQSRQDDSRGRAKGYAGWLEGPGGSSHRRNQGNGGRPVGLDASGAPGSDRIAGADFPRRGAPPTWSLGVWNSRPL